jgi:hypothetical protein
VLAASALLSAALARAAWHLNDLSGMGHIPGDWMALAQSLNRGVFYPPLEEDGYYAGTRYMPLLFCLIAGVQRVVGDYLLATKMITVVAGIALAAATFAVVRRVIARWLEAVTLAGLVFAFPEGLHALLAPHADALAIALSVWGLFLLSSPAPRAAAVILAALLMALAFATKFSAVAAPVAGMIFLLPRQAKAGIALGSIFGGLVVASLALIHFASQGRFEENFRALASGGMSLDFMKMAPARLVGGLVISSIARAFVVPFVLPLAVVTVVQNWRNGGLTLWDWYFLVSIVTTLVIFGSPGTDINHLLEIEVASVLVVAQRLKAPAPTAGPLLSGPRPLGSGAGDGSLMVAARMSDALVTRTILLIPLLLGAYFALRNPAWREGDDQGFYFWQQREPTFATLAAALPAEPHLLTEDSTPVVLLGQRPVVMDAFAFKLLAENKVIDDQKLADRISAREFNGLVMLRRLEDPHDQQWRDQLERFHFGQKVNDALRGAYRLDRQVGQYFIYVPAPPEQDGKAPGHK